MRPLLNTVRFNSICVSCKGDSLLSYNAYLMVLLLNTSAVHPSVCLLTSLSDDKSYIIYKNCFKTVHWLFKKVPWRISFILCNLHHKKHVLLLCIVHGRTECNILTLPTQLGTNLLTFYQCDQRLASSLCYLFYIALVHFNLTNLSLVWQSSVPVTQLITFLTMVPVKFTSQSCTGYNLFHCASLLDIKMKDPT